MLLRKGEIVFRQDEFGDQAFLIEKGKVEIFHTHKNGHETHLAVLTEGEIFGEMALIDSNVRSATARAFTDCQLLPINKEQLLDKLDSSDPTVQMIVQILLNRLRQQNLSKSGITLENMPETETKTNVVDRIKLENQINDALQNNEFILYHQPIIEFSSGNIIGSEALLRWESPQKGLIAPGLFIDILENSSMIIPVGFWIIEECFRHFKIIEKQIPQNKNISISINVSSRQFSNNNFIKNLKSLVDKHQVSPRNFKLEVTERVMVDAHSIIGTLDKCRDMGFEISLDDFGTGFSSLQYLSRMPIDYLKIDRSFVINATKDLKTKAVISAIIYLARNLNIKTIAEGVETATEESMMKSMGAEYGQGYFYSKPVSFENFLKII